jgi:large conductance mechanosensitive channel
MSVVKEFKEFAVQGSVMDLAVGIVIGAAFKSIIDSFVADILTPLIGLLTGGIDFTNRFIVLGAGHFATLEEAKKAGVATLNYGLFINAVLNFVIVAFVLFLVVKRLNRMRKAEGQASAG